MVDWQVTATSIYCDAVDEEVTILVFKDWSVKCTGFVKYGEPGSNARELLKKGRRLKRQLQCEGPECQRVIKYREKLQAEEAGKKKPVVDR
jgi:hypothetical protein